jgi:hypothetical protein
MKKLLLMMAFATLTLNTIAQTQIQNSGWLTLVNNTKFNEKWGVALDVQFRSADNWSYLRNVLVRPGITYYINSASNVTAGFLYATTRTELPTGTTNLVEQRIWEQFIYNHKIKSSFATHRLRLEQRFMETNTGDIFAQRARYFFRMLQPLQRSPSGFDQGIFIALQNELFFNIQNKDALNKSLFDQNRFMIAAGYRFAKKIDLEAGYLNQYIHGATTNTSNRVLQLALYTRF